MSKVMTYKTLSSNYSRKAPQGFRQFAIAHGTSPRNVNTCAVRLSYALFLSDKKFFKEVDANLEWYGLPTKASELAIVLNEEFGPAKKVIKSDISGNHHKGIVFFDTIPGFGGSGHITMWNGSSVLDDGDYFGVSPRVYFWSLP